MKKTVKWGIIGCGMISTLHCNAVEMAENAELAAVCDIVEEKARKAAEKYHVEKVYVDYRDLLADPEIDVVSICTPSGIHGEMAQAAARAGKHILCEKPMEITREKIDKTIEVVEACGVKMGCVFQRRLQRESIAIKQALDSGKFGKVILADAYLKYYRSPEYYKSADWRATWELDGGGALMNQGVHGIDLLTWFVGDVESVFARCATMVRDIEVEDTAVISLKFKNGAIGVIEGATSVYPAQETRFEIHCEKGSIIFSDKGITQWKIEGSDETAPDFGESGFAMKDDPSKLSSASHLALVTDLADAVINDRDPMVMPREARKAVDLILSIYQSSDEHREITL